MGSVYAPGQPPLHFYSHQIVNPVNKMMLVEDNGDPVHAQVLAGSADAVIDDGRWVPPGNILSARHKFPKGTRPPRLELLNKGRGMVQFADGHVDTLSPGKAQLPEFFDPMR